MPVLEVDKKGERHTLSVAEGKNLREALLEADLSPYTALTSRINCGGRGLCATCGVHFLEGEPRPKHWHDKLADRFSYPRLSCQIRVRNDMRIEIPKKVIWGNRKRK